MAKGGLWALQCLKKAKIKTLWGLVVGQIQNFLGAVVCFGIQGLGGWFGVWVSVAIEPIKTDKTSQNPSKSIKTYQDPSKQKKPKKNPWESFRVSTPEVFSLELSLLTRLLHYRRIGDVTGSLCHFPLLAQLRGVRGRGVGRGICGGGGRRWGGDDRPLD